MLAQGAYGVLYRGLYEGEQVAVKLLRTDGCSPEEQIEIFQEFRKEVSIMASVHHANVVALKGVCYSGSEIGMVMELVDSGDLHHLIKDKAKTLSIPICIKIAFDIAEGLHFLHNLPTPILHRDLKPGNVLLASDDTKWKYTAKLADFGLSTVQYLYKLKERAVETPIWLPPEILSGGSYAAPSDVFAFGIIFYEMIERRGPYDNFDFRFLNELEEDIISGKRCDLSHTQTYHPGIAKLISACWHGDPKQRPNFKEVMETLIDLTKPVDEELCVRLTKRLSNISHVSLPSEAPTTLPLVTGKFVKQIHTDPLEAITCMVAVGDDVWVAHKNCDISIWDSHDASMFRLIIAAHPVEVLTMKVADSCVWAGTQNAMLGSWKSRRFADSYLPNSSKMLKEGYLEPADGSPAIFVALKDGDKELSEGLSLVRSKTLPMNDKNRFGFSIQTEDGTHRFFCANKDDSNKWITALNTASDNLSEATEDLKLGLIPHHRLLQIHSLVYDSNRLFVGTSDLIVRVYDTKSSALLSEFTLILPIDASVVVESPKAPIKEPISTRTPVGSVLRAPTPETRRKAPPRPSGSPQRNTFMASSSLKR